MFIIKVSIKGEKVFIISFYNNIKEYIKIYLEY
jgi:hypothetical protein